MTITMEENKNHSGVRVTVREEKMWAAVFVNYAKFSHCEIYVTEDYKATNDRACLSYYKGKISMRVINVCGKCASIAMCDTMEQAEALKSYIEKISKNF